MVGLKPSYGVVSRWGVVSFADSLDCVGVMASTVDEAQKVFDLVSVYDAKDPTSVMPEVRKRASRLSSKHQEGFDAMGSLEGLRIGVPQEYFPAELRPSTLAPLRRLLQTLKSRGASLIPVSLPSTPYALSAYYVISSAEASSNMARYDGIEFGLSVPPPPGTDIAKASNVYAYTRSHGFGLEVQKRILLGTYALSADAFNNYYLQAQRVRKRVKADFNRVFCVPNALSAPSEVMSSSRGDGVHVLLHPSAIQTAPLLPTLHPPAREGDGLDAYVQDVLTVPASLAGLPALSIPAGVAGDGWPVGVSVVGQWGCDGMVLDVGRICEASITDCNNS